MSAYTLSRMEFKGRKLIRNLALLPWIIPVMATIIPLFRIFVNRQLLDNVFWLSVVYVSSYLPMITWLMSNYFSTIPKELEEAAVIDGGRKICNFYEDHTSYLLSDHIVSSAYYVFKYLGISSRFH